MFFRGRQPDTSIWKRFRTGLDGFTFLKEPDYYSAHVVANAWRGERVALPDVQDAVGRLKVPLASAGGVELSVFSADDQLTLNPHLELFIYARSDRWYYFLTGMGLEERQILRTKRWKLARHDYD